MPNYSNGGEIERETEKELERQELQRLHEESAARKIIVKKKLSAKGDIKLRVANGESKETINKYIKGEYPSMSDGLIDSLITMRMNMYKQEKEEERKKIKEEERKKIIEKFQKQLDRVTNLKGKTEEEQKQLEAIKQRLSARIEELNNIKYKLKF